MAGEEQQVRLHPVFKDVQELVQCSICLDPLVDPRLLPCLHSFCLHCLEESYAGAVTGRRQAEEVFLCPTCRASHALPDDGLQSLPSDYRAHQLQDLMRRHSRTGHNSSILEKALCFVCEASDLFSAGTHYCFRCQEFMCVFCANTHQLPEKESPHAIVDLVKNKDECVCVEHNRIIQKFCLTCCVTICEQCSFGEHETHDVAEFVDGQQPLPGHDSMERMKRYTDNFVGTLREKAAQLPYMQESASEKWQQTKAAISSHVLSLIEKLHRMELELHTSCDAEYDTINTEISTNTKKLEEILLVAEKQQRTIQKMMEPFTDNSIRLSHFPLERLARDSSSLCFIGDHQSAFRLEFNPGEIDPINIGEPLTRQQQSTGDGLGEPRCLWTSKMEEQDAIWDVAFCHDPDDNDNDLFCTLSTLTMIRLGQNGSPVWITGVKDHDKVVAVATNSSGSIASVCKTLDNKFLLQSKKAGGEYTMVPCDVTSRLNRVSVGPNGKVVTTSFPVSGTNVACFYDESLELVWSRTLCDDKKPILATWTCMDHINRIICSAMYDTKLHIFDKSGEWIKSFPLPAMPNGLCVDSTGNIIVALTNKQINMYNPNGEFLQTVLKLANKPLSLAIRNDRYLAVGTAETGEVMLYDLWRIVLLK